MMDKQVNLGQNDRKTNAFQQYIEIHYAGTFNISSGFCRVSLGFLSSNAFQHAPHVGMRATPI